MPGILLRKAKGKVKEHYRTRGFAMFLRVRTIILLANAIREGPLFEINDGLTAYAD